ncbi:MAG: SDR family NAD(P)-dependent oxidoreductase [Pseudomonadota bacterium]
MGRVEGKTVFVTGGCGGIGRAMCERFAREGADVIAADVATWEDCPDGIEVLHYDVTSEEAAKTAMADVMARWGRLDVLVNGAGIELEKTIEDTSLEEWNTSFAVNVTGMFLTSKYALPALVAANGSSVINFGSYDGFIADPGLACYCATKGAVHALTRAMAVDHGPDGVRVNAVCPGFIETPMLDAFFKGDGAGGDGHSPEALKEAACDVHPIRSYGQPEDVANLVLWLASDEARYASGQLWVIDGGLSAQVQQMKL